MNTTSDKPSSLRGSDAPAEDDVLVARRMLLRAAAFSAPLVVASLTLSKPVRGATCTPGGCDPTCDPARCEPVICAPNET